MIFQLSIYNTVYYAPEKKKHLESCKLANYLTRLSSIIPVGGRGDLTNRVGTSIKRPRHPRDKARKTVADNARSTATGFRKNYP